MLDAIGLHVSATARAGHLIIQFLFLSFRFENKIKLNMIIEKIKLTENNEKPIEEKIRNSSGYLSHIISVFSFFSVYVISEIIKTLQLSTIAKNPVYVAYFK